ncbi:polysaccharide pyruvyl transferase family protein [Buttiauxella sp. S04-F03]|uniref:polysaccharide pyruvyl transferase family protein n=1 Tax=Buttiauxella sp. W03-F01 TaxID=2904524 RepID=UPI001E34ED59|nr:polysaccharide pyruvyl transferase family protein [Buttiauxella sp. W03-F01]MCE0800530.1 polysaccharide pyruvyl transferase family protein [Buttiauxella sp. W03-F01]
MGKLIEAFFSVSTEIQERFSSIGKDIVPVNYYTRHNNWGDQLNKYLIGKITKKIVVKNNFKKFKHILAIGSVLSSASEKSLIWGSGFISKDVSLKSTNLDIRAVRGTLTRERLQTEFLIDCPNVLGDPAVLLPFFYDAAHITKKYKIGIIPHYKDKNFLAVHKLVAAGCVLIDIQDDIEPFIDKINECEFIVSSSLHGLIAADTYGIPNKWLSFSNMLLGGKFKFMDYYSTTTNKNPNPLVINSEDNVSISKLIDECGCNDFIKNKKELLDAFPKEFI